MEGVINLEDVLAEVARYKTKEIMTEEELMDYLGVDSSTTIRKYEKMGLKVSKIGRKKFYEFNNVRKFLKKYEM